MTSRHKIKFLAAASAVGAIVELVLYWLVDYPADQTVFVGNVTMLIADILLGCWCVAQRYENPWLGMYLIHIPLARAVVGELPLLWIPGAVFLVCIGIFIAWFHELVPLVQRRI
ncbi:MAG: hypothetical protein WCK01_00865 [Candidatus Uhrbacteria bacterium]